MKPATTGVSSRKDPLKYHSFFCLFYHFLVCSFILTSIYFNLSFLSSFISVISSIFRDLHLSGVRFCIRKLHYPSENSHQKTMGSDSNLRFQLPRIRVSLSTNDVWSSAHTPWDDPHLSSFGTGPQAELNISNATYIDEHIWNKIGNIWIWF